MLPYEILQRTIGQEGANKRMKTCYGLALLLQNHYLKFLRKKGQDHWVIEDKFLDDLFIDILSLICYL